MAKKEGAKQKDSGAFLVSAIEQLVGREIHSIGDWIRSIVYLKMKMGKMTALFAMSAAGATIILYGISRLAMDYMPAVRDGWVYIIVGVLGIISGMVYRRF